MGSLSIKPRRRLVELLAVATCAIAEAVIADDGSGARVPKFLAIEDGRDPAPVGNRRLAIQHELATQPAGHPWAGSYYEGDGTGANVSLQIAPHAGVAATWNGCMGLYGANEGGVSEESDGSLRLAFNWENHDDQFGNFPAELVPVPWGERSYLIPPHRLVSFVNAIHHGFEPRTGSHGMYYLRVGDENRAVRGLPSLPPEHLALIRSEAKVFSVVDVERLADRPNDFYCDTAWRLTIATGGDGQLRRGTELVVARPRTSGVDATIVDLNATTAVAEMAIYAGDTCQLDEAEQPNSSWQLGTGAYQPGR